MFTILLQVLLRAEWEYQRIHSFWNVKETIRITTNSHFYWSERGITSNTSIVSRSMPHIAKPDWRSNGLKMETINLPNRKSTIMSWNQVFVVIYTEVSWFSFIFTYWSFTFQIINRFITFSIRAFCFSSITKRAKRLIGDVLSR